jgi:hypothetical protein
MVLSLSVVVRQRCGYVVVLLHVVLIIHGNVQEPILLQDRDPKVPPVQLRQRWWSLLSVDDHHQQKD